MTTFAERVVSPQGEDDNIIEVRKPQLYHKFIGYSMNRCIADIIDGIVDPQDILCLITRTKIESPEQAMNVYWPYQGTYWESWEEHAKAKEISHSDVKSIVRELWPRILQPRFYGMCHENKTDVWSEIKAMDYAW